MRSLPVRLRPEAKADLNEIFDFICQRSGSAEAAAQFIGRILARCESIGDVPYGGVARDDLVAGIRMVSFERSAVILYRISDDAVEVVTVAYGGRQYDALFGD